MCIICVKPTGIEMPTEATLETMWENNPDGAGFMYVANGNVNIEKGFMTYKAFKSAIDVLATKYRLKDIPLVMHFRITTHGGTKPSNCHPFPVTENIGMLQKLSIKSEWGVAHNGILNITPRAGISDTMEYIATQMAVMKKINHRFAENKYFLEMIANATVGSRLVMMNNKGDLFFTGNWIEDGGLVYSNSNYKYSYFRSYKYDNTYKSYYDYGTKNLWTDWDLDYPGDVEEKSVCEAEEIGAKVIIEGKEVDYNHWPTYYIDNEEKLYWYSDLDDAIVEVKAKYEIKYEKGATGFKRSLASTIMVTENPRDYNAISCEYCGCDDADEYYETNDGEIVCGKCKDYLGLPCTKVD